MARRLVMEKFLKASGLLQRFPKNARLLTDSFVKDNKPEAYITYRSCIPAINEEKLSVLGFEV